jgi:hypothetical protein
VAGPEFRIDRGSRTRNQALVKQAAAEISAVLQRRFDCPKIPV